MLNRTDSQPSVTCLLTCPTAQTTIACRSCSKNQHQSTTPEHSDLPCIRTASVAPRPSIDNVSLNHLLLTHVLPVQLDCPPDHNPTCCPIHTPQNSPYPLSAQHAMIPSLRRFDMACLLLMPIPSLQPIPHLY